MRNVLRDQLSDSLNYFDYLHQFLNDFGFLT